MTIVLLFKALQWLAVYLWLISISYVLFTYSFVTLVNAKHRFLLTLILLYASMSEKDILASITHEEIIDNFALLSARLKSQLLFV